MLEKLRIGLIVKPQGVRGEVKVVPLTDNPNRFKKLKKVFIDNVEYDVLSSKIAVDSVILSLSGISDRNLAETFRNKFLEVDRKNAVPLDDGKFFVADLIGLKVVDLKGENFGKIVDIIENKTDIISIDNGGKIGYFPFLKALEFTVDFEKGSFIVNGERLKEVLVYED